MPRSSFFSRIQSWFGAAYDGRYLAYILAEIGKHHPKSIAGLLCSTLGLGRRELAALVLEPEYVFQGVRGPRRADLAVFASADDPEPVVLIEIKYRDKLIPESDVKPAQLADYVHWKAKTSGRHVLVLSRETLRLDGVVAKTWTEAASLLRADEARSDMIKALLEHLKEEGIVMQKIDSRILVGFLKRLLVPQYGAGAHAGNLNGPAEFSKLLQNIKLLSARFNPLFKQAWKEAGDKHNKLDDPYGTKDASIDFAVKHHLKVPARAELTTGEENALRDSAKNGGVVEVYARHSLGSGEHWLRVGYGVWIEVSKSSSYERPNLPNIWLYSWLRGASVKETLWEQRKLSSFDLLTTNAEESIDTLDRLARRLVKKNLETVRQSSKALTPKQATAVRILLKSLE